VKMLFPLLQRRRFKACGGRGIGIGAPAVFLKAIAMVMDSPFLYFSGRGKVGW